MTNESHSNKDIDQKNEDRVIKMLNAHQIDIDAWDIRISKL